MNSGSRYSVIGTQTMLQAGNSRDSHPGRGKRLLSKTSGEALGPNQPPVQWVSSYFPEAKRQGQEVNHTPQSSAKVKNKCSYTSIPLHAFIVWEGKSFIETDQPPSPSQKIRSSVIK